MPEESHTPESLYEKDRRERRERQAQADQEYEIEQARKAAERTQQRLKAAEQQAKTERYGHEEQREEWARERADLEEQLADLKEQLSTAQAQRDDLIAACITGAEHAPKNLPVPIREALEMAAALQAEVKGQPQPKPET